MKLDLYKSLWGLEGSFDELLSRAAEAGFVGVETVLPAKEQEADFRKALERNRLAYIVQIHTFGPDHAESFAELASRAASFGPVHIVSQSARDKMSEAEQDRFFERALEVERKLGVPIAHETHRHRAMFAPWTTARLLRKFPDLKLTVDFSHWTNVCESLLEDMEDYIRIAIRHAYHIHARVGHAQGPQVPHPGGKEWARELARFEGWWQQIIDLRSGQGHDRQTITPEFGPRPYMPVLPFTGVPVCDLWEVNLWMAGRLRERFGS